MKTRNTLVLMTIIPALAIAGCSKQDTEPTQTQPTSSAKSTVKKPAHSTTTRHETPAAHPASAQPTTQTTAQPVPQASTTIEQPTQPYIVECLFGTPGPTRMSDGTIQNTEYCGNQPGAAAQRESEANAGLPAPQTQQQQPSPWVQGQLDWANCIQSGKTQQQCRNELN